MCGKLVYALLIFVFIQIQLRWKHDKSINNSPWMVVWKGKTSSFPFKTGTDFVFDLQSIKYGTPLIALDENTFRLKERSEIEMHLVIKIKAPALSFHRVSILINNVEFRTQDMFVPPGGVSNSDMMARFILGANNNIRIHHYYDSVWTEMGDASATISLGFRNGLPNIYDAPFK